MLNQLIHLPLIKVKMYISPEGETFYLYINISGKWKELPSGSIYLSNLTTIEAQAASSD